MTNDSVVAPITCGFMAKAQKMQKYYIHSRLILLLTNLYGQEVAYRFHYFDQVTFKKRPMTSVQPLKRNKSFNLVCEIDVCICSRHFWCNFARTFFCPNQATLPIQRKDYISQVCGHFDF